MSKDRAALTVDEPVARKLLLLQAVEAVDDRGALVSEAERDQAEQTLLRQRGVPTGTAPSASWYLPARAGALLDIVERRNPRLLRLAQRDPWWDRAAILLPLAALLIGFSTERLGNPHEIDLLSVPLLGFVAWNLVIYAVLVVSALSGGKLDLASRMQAWVAEMPSAFRERAAAHLRHSVAGQFRLLWWRLAGRIEGGRVQRVLHASAAAWAVGLVVAILALGLGREFRVGWESTFLQPSQVHGIVSVVSLPGRLVAGLEPYTLADVQQLQHFRSTGQGEARRWAWVYILFLLATVIVPRALMALWASARIRQRGNALKVDLADPYFVQVMARVSPVRWAVAVHACDAQLRQALQCILRQAGPVEAASSSWRTIQGDEFAQAEALDAEVDQHWIGIDRLEDLEPLLAAGQVGSEARVLLLCGSGASPKQAQAVVAARGVICTALELNAVAPCWALEARLREALQGQVPDWKRAGVQRLMDAWARHHRERFDRAMALLADLLSKCAADSEELRGVWPGAKGREVATTALVERLQQRLALLHDALVQLHAVDALAQPPTVQRGKASFGDMLNPGSAGAAGVLAGGAAGALAGAKIDLLTGGLTLGAGAALGAVVGGVGAFGAARWWNLGGTVRLTDEQLQSLAESLLLQYLAIAHAGRVAEAHAQALLPHWCASVNAAFSARVDALRSAWKQLREGGTATTLQDLMDELRAAAHGALVLAPADADRERQATSA